MAGTPRTGRERATTTNARTRTRTAAETRAQIESGCNPHSRVVQAEARQEAMGARPSSSSRPSCRRGHRRQIITRGPTRAKGWRPAE